MYLKRLEVQGFKTFAKKTALDFPAPKPGSNPLTVIVGPNGSGKSNLADAIRWCLGEQSMKQLRGKDSQDIIFSGSEGKGRANVAEVSMTFDNEDKNMPIEAPEVTITRRLYRDGEGEYLLQGQSVRLADIQLLLAEAGVGQRSYSVIGQGMVDHVLTASPEERKIFFDDATGVRGLQIRRHQAMLKLERSAKNLSDVDALLKEIEPRLALLRRQVKRLTDRERIEVEYRDVAVNYFATQYWNFVDEKAIIDRKVQQLNTNLEQKKAELAAGDEKLLTLEKSEIGKNQDDGSTQGLQAAYKAAQSELADARRAQFVAEREIELAKVRVQSSWSPLPLSDIIGELKELTGQHESLLGRLRGVKSLDEIEQIISDVEGAFSRSKKLRDRLIKPAPEDVATDPVLLAAAKAAVDHVKQIEQKVTAAEKAMDEKAKAATSAKSEVFAFQRELRQLHADMTSLESQRNTHAVEVARVETRIESLKSEVNDTLDATAWALMTKEAPTERSHNLAELHDKVMRLRHQLEMIGGIDPEVIKEHQEVDERFTFLTTQVTDLRQAIASTEKIVDELDEEIRKQSEKAFRAINEQFQKYFKVLFNGGSCSLVKLSHDEVTEANQVTLDRAMEQEAHEHNPDEQTSEDIASRIAVRKEAVAGIEIQATPPGKKLKALNLLSGGERALTSIALLSAIMETNPSPFVVLDEVDAALDEANTVRFANILNELRIHTQFIVISHNRATMEKADTLYGVTMGNDGLSALLSVKLDDIGTGGTARR